MQAIRQLMNALERLATPEACLFTLADLRAILPLHSDSAFKTLLSRAVAEKRLSRICRGVYLLEKACPDRGLLLFHVVTKLRPLALNYLSLETVLSDAGVISQIPINRIMIMSTGRNNLIDCGALGTIEFVHTRQLAPDLVERLHFDVRCRLWRASVSQALRDMRATHRSLDLIDWKAADELVRSTGQ